MLQILRTASYKGFPSYYKLKSFVRLHSILVWNMKQSLCDTKEILCHLQTFALYYVSSKSNVLQSTFYVGIYGIPRVDDRRQEIRNCAHCACSRHRADPPSTRSEHNFLFLVFYWLPLEYSTTVLQSAQVHEQRHAREWFPRVLFGLERERLALLCGRPTYWRATSTAWRLLGARRLRRQQHLCGE